MAKFAWQPDKLTSLSQNINVFLLTTILCPIVHGEITDFTSLPRLFDKVHDHRDPYYVNNAAVRILFNLPEMNTDNYTAIYFNENVKYIVILVHVVCNRQYEKCGFLEIGNFVEFVDRYNVLFLRDRKGVNPEYGDYFHFVLPTVSKNHPLILRYELWVYDKTFKGFYMVSILPAYDKSESGCSKSSYKEVFLTLYRNDVSVCMDCFSPIVLDYVAKFNKSLAKKQICDKGRDEIADTSDTLPQIVIGVTVTVLIIIIIIGIIVAVVCCRRRRIRIQLDDPLISRESEPDTGRNVFLEEA